MFPYLPQRPAYNKRLRVGMPLVKRAIRSPAADTDLWLDDLFTPVESARPRETVNSRLEASHVPLTRLSRIGCHEAADGVTVVVVKQDLTCVIWTQQDWR
jgi:hypothetical protein